MAERDRSQRVILFSDVPGDEEKVRAILAGWGVEETSIRRLMREHPPRPDATHAEVEAAPRIRADA